MALLLCYFNRQEFALFDYPLLIWRAMKRKEPEAESISLRVAITRDEFLQLRRLALDQNTTAPRLIAEQIRKLLAKRPKP